MAKVKINLVTKKALEISMERFAKASKDSKGCMFDKETGAISMKPSYLAEQYGCTTVYAKFIMAHGVASLEAVSKLSKIFDLKMHEFIKLGET